MLTNKPVYSLTDHHIYTSLGIQSNHNVEEHVITSTTKPMTSSIKIIHDCQNTNEIRFDHQSKRNLKERESEKIKNGLISHTILDSQHENGSMVSSLGKIIYSHRIHQKIDTNQAISLQLNPTQKYLDPIESIQKSNDIEIQNSRDINILINKFKSNTVSLQNQIKQIHKLKLYEQFSEERNKLKLSISELEIQVKKIRIQNREQKQQKLKRQVKIKQITKQLKQYRQLNQSLTQKDNQLCQTLTKLKQNILTKTTIINNNKEYSMKQLQKNNDIQCEKNICYEDSTFEYIKRRQTEIIKSKQSAFCSRLTQKDIKSEYQDRVTPIIPIDKNKMSEILCLQSNVKNSSKNSSLKDYFEGNDHFKAKFAKLMIERIQLLQNQIKNNQQSFERKQIALQKQNNCIKKSLELFRTQVFEIDIRKQKLKLQGRNSVRSFDAYVNSLSPKILSKQSKFNQIQNKFNRSKISLQKNKIKRLKSYDNESVTSLQRFSYYGQKTTRNQIKEQKELTEATKQQKY